MILSICFVSLTAFIASATQAQDPLNIDGEYNYPPINGIDLGTTVLINGVGGGVYEVHPSEDFVLPVINCKVFASDLLVRLTPLGNDQYSADLFFYDIKLGGGDPGRGLCAYVPKGTKTVTLIPMTEGILLRFIDQGLADQFFARVGPIVTDKSAPTAFAGSTTLKVGKSGKIKYGCKDNSGESKAIIKILVKGKAKKTIKVGLKSATAQKASSSALFTPTQLYKTSSKNKTSYTVQCIDAADNKSTVVAGKLKVS